MSFNSDWTKQAFSLGLQPLFMPLLHLCPKGYISETFENDFDSKLNFKEHISQKINKTSKGVSIIRKLRSLLCSLLPALYKSFVR